MANKKYPINDEKYYEEADAAAAAAEAKIMAVPAFAGTADAHETAANAFIAEQLKEGVIFNKTPSDSGLYHTDARMTRVRYNKAPNEKVIRKHDAYIVFGSDRPSTKASGRGRASNRAASIDLVVGRLSSQRRDRATVKKLTAVGPSFEADAARVLISQLSKVDLNFGIARTARETLKDGETGEPPRSTVAIKSDMTRIIGRNGVKIVTGKMKNKNEKNSLGGKMGIYAPPILLMAGNMADTRTTAATKYVPSSIINDLQPLVLGDNTRDAFNEIGGIIEQIQSALFNLVLIQTSFNAVLGIDPLRPWVPAAASAAITQTLTQVVNSLYHTRVNKVMWEINYLAPFGYKYICSRNVKST